MNKLTKRLVSIAAAVAACAGATGVAYATGWLTFGTATASTGVASAQSLTVSASLNTSQALYPGSSIDATVTISNYNSGPVTVTSIASTSVDIDDAHGILGCKATSFKFTQPPALPTLNSYASGWEDGSYQATVVGSLMLDSGAPVACAGASITLHLKASGQMGAVPTASPSSSG
jgi:hypothetical protein